jgi:hypothetical protein
MERDIEVQGVMYRVKYDWDDDARTNMCITSIHVGDSPDLYDALSRYTIDEIDSKLQDSFRE